jgi:site-specific DNA-methyltransferase (adenine-specific)
MSNTHKLIKGDCLEVLRSLPDSSVDLIVTDPPYKLEMPKKDIFDYQGEGESLMKKKKMRRVKEKWDEFTLEDYMAWSEEWILESMKKLKPHGSMFVFGSYHNIGLINYLLQKNKLMIINDICWYKRNAVPNLACRRLTASYESILWFAKDKKYTFNYKDLKHGDFPKDNLKKPDKQMRNVWDIPTAGKESVGHPTQKPISLYERCIMTGINKEADNPTVLDFFAGSGVAAVAAENLGYSSIMVEREQDYIDKILARLEEYENFEYSVFNT